MALSRDFFERRANRLFKEWDSIDDPYGLPLPDFLRAIQKVNEASLIIMMLHTMDKEIKKCLLSVTF